MTLVVHRGGTATLSSNYVTAIRSAYGAGGWDYASAGKDLLTNGVPSHWWLRTDVRSSRTNSISAPEVSATWE